MTELLKVVRIPQISGAFRVTKAMCQGKEKLPGDIRGLKVTEEGGENGYLTQRNGDSVNVDEWIVFASEYSYEFVSNLEFNSKFRVLERETIDNEVDEDQLELPFGN